MSVGSKPVLEVGSNLFELIEFTVTRPRAPQEASTSRVPSKPMIYGVNVAKVREVIRMPEIVPCLTSCPEVLGVANLRGVPVPVIHLALALGYSDEPVATGGQMIVTEFAGRIAGFIVTSTRRIRRVSWDKVLPPTSDAFSSITGMMVIENGDFLFLIDFEQIMLGIDSKSGKSSPVTSGGGGPNVRTASRVRTVALVDDSPVARRAVSEILRNAGLNVLEFSDGEQAWAALKDPGLAHEVGRLDLVVSDIEMPRLDGYSLVKRIRGDADLAALPVILHSSLTGESNREQARVVGANAFVAKFNRREILESIHALLGDGSVALSDCRNPREAS